MTSMHRLVDVLWTSEAESHWNPQGPGDPASPLLVLKSHLNKILKMIHDFYPNVDSSYAAIAGIESGGFYTPIVAINRELKKISCTSPHDTLNKTLVSEYLYSGEEIQVIPEPQLKKHFRGDPDIRTKLIIKLSGFGELFGFISLDSKTHDAFDNEMISELRYSQKALSRVLSDSVFTMRLWDLTFSADRFSTNLMQIDKLYNEICESTVKAFASSGAILRKYNPSTGHLDPVGTSGNIAPALLERGSIGEHVTEFVYSNSEFSWTVGMNDDGDPFFSGVEIPKELEAELKEDGIQAYCVFKLDSIAATDDAHSFGTLSFYHRHPHHFSWRDIALARSLVRRATDLIALRRNQILLREERNRLKETTEELELTNQILEAENETTTRAEIVTLLAHDLGHKALLAKNNFEKFENSVRKAMSNKPPQPFNSVVAEAGDAEDAISQLISGLSNVNQVYSQGFEEDKEKLLFKLSDVVGDVVNTLDNALHRHNMPTDISVSSSIFINGERKVLVQVLFNLIINSIQAQRGRRHRRKNVLHIHAEKQEGKSGDRVLIKIWDEGPGINLGAFGDARDIFKLGVSSKENGTGRGLPISRNLLATFFRGEIKLIDPKSALFHLSIPAKV